MIALAGNISLCFALFFSFMQSFPVFYSYKNNNPYLRALARPSAIGQCVFVIIAYLLLTMAFVTHDFSLAYVAAHSHPALPLMYRLAAVWGGHEGSILLWIVMLNIWTMAFWFFTSNAISLDKTLTLSLFGFINFCFLCFLFFTSNPFITSVSIFIPQDLNPLLQDPGLVIHPPMLYAGYVGFSAAFAITQAALLRGKLDTTWARVTRHFALAAWCLLTLGITLGSWWAYRVLGWGGFWFWDPVENAALLPWLSGVAFIHVLLLVEKRSAAVSWAAFLSIITFALSLLGTFLVRSGILISAHTFANDPARGVFLLILFAVLLCTALLIYVIRLPTLSSSFSFSWFSRESSLMLNSGLFFIAMLTVLLGTLYPLIFDAFHWGEISVGPPYFNKVLLPLLIVTLILMGLAPLCEWKDQSLFSLYQKAIKKILLSMLIAGFFIFSLMSSFSFFVFMMLSFNIMIILSVMSFLRLRPGMALAHTGFAIFLMGILLSSLLSQERDVRMQPGNTVQLGPYQFIFLDTQGIQASNYRGIRAAFEVVKNEHHVAMLYPEKRIYTVRDSVMTKVAIQPGLFRDLYIALGEPLNDNDWTVRIYYKPFIRWIWFGGLLIMLGGIFSVMRKKHACAN